MTLLLGIDPGKQGAIAILDKAALAVVTHDMPDTTVGLIDLLSSLPPVLFCAIEKPYYPKVIGLKNAAKIAEAYGAIKAILAFRGIPVHETRPADWKAALNLGANKSASREKASQIFPDNADQWPLVKHDGRAEAALIAWHGLRWCK